jgi:hypothetical protein
VDQKVKGPIVIMCAIPLLVGLDYVIFLDEDNFIIQDLGRGTRFLSAPRGEDRACHGRQCVLEKFRNLSTKR